MPLKDTAAREDPISLRQHRKQNSFIWFMPKISETKCICMLMMPIKVYMSRLWSTCFHFLIMPFSRQWDLVSEVADMISYLRLVVVVFSCSSSSGSQGQQPQQGSTNSPLPSHFYQLLLSNPQAFPDQKRDIIRPSCHWLAPGPPSSGT